jgi:hypothetical protein
VSRRLWVCSPVPPHAQDVQVRNFAIYGPGMLFWRRFEGHHFISVYRCPFGKGRHLLHCDDFLQRTFLCGEPLCYLTQSPHYGQVLTGILPYDGRDKAHVVADIALGKRPPRPTDPSQNQWLQDPVWDMITACWSGESERRPKLSAVYRVFLKYGRREARNVERGKVLPRIASLFQFLRSSVPEIERIVGEMDKAGSSTFPPLILRLT